jgi:hypothetical protein
VSAGFTPGPWHADFGETFRIREGDGSSVAYTQFVHLRGRRDTEEATANARLIAAAPELYEALELIWREWSLSCDPTDDFPDWPQDAMGVMNDAYKNGFAEKARAAIAKARGETA